MPINKKRAMIDLLKSVKAVPHANCFISNTCNLKSHQLICLIFVTHEVKTALIGGAEAQFKKNPNFYEISRHISTLQKEPTDILAKLCYHLEMVEYDIYRLISS